MSRIRTARSFFGTPIADWDGYPFFAPGLLKVASMVCNVNHFGWPRENSSESNDMASFARPLPATPHPDTPYVVVLLKMLSVADELSDSSDEFED
ncbi:hypothetical protein ACYFX5_22085 [Bremerella sp. T1]|uniref:hypothetical protein n=1 Tax=Bremerella sp. TYQ1 TaxID=3119568 RepID=UPI001CCEFDEC|nr:hypothetical protein [Bremerella volcania]UBM35730.1 hypothetical protein LA756_24025 [Bremerella volcania]